MKPKLYFVGSSHSRRLHLVLKQSIRQDKFELVNLAKGGSVFKDTVLTFPKASSLGPQDIIVINTFGNDLFEKNIDFQRNSSGKKEIHLRKCIPKSLEEIRKLHKKLIELVLQVPNKVILIDCIYRHLCLPECKDRTHFYPGILAFQSKHNKVLYQDFANIPNLEIIRHINCMPGRVQFWRSFSNYQQLLSDKVHLKEEYYLCIVEEIWARINGVNPTGSITSV